MPPHGLQHARFHCPSPSPRACSNSCVWSRWCHPTISSCIVPFSSCHESLPASESFPVSHFFTSDGQSIGASASASVLPMNIQDWFPLGLTGLISLLSKGLKNTFQHNSKASILRCPAFFMVQFSHLYMTTRKIICIRLLESQKLLEKKLWLYGPLSTKWCLCFSICCLGLS